MILTWRLWRLLHQPPQEHPIFRYFSLSPVAQVPWYLWLLGVLLVPLSFGLVVLLPAAAFGLLWATQISDRIVLNAQRGTYELLGTIPPGLLGAHWMLCLATVHHNFSFERLRSGMIWFWVVRLIAMVIYLDDLVPAEPDQDRTAARLAAVVFAGMALLIENYQSPVMSALVGMLAPTYINDRLTVRLFSAGLVVALQLISYIMPLMIGLLLADLLALPVQAELILVYGVMFVLYAVVRELTIAALWQTLLYRLETSASEVREALDWFKRQLI